MTAPTPQTLADAAALVRTITQQTQAEEAAYQRGLRDASRFYRAIFDHGVDVGYRAAEHALDESWRLLAAKIRAAANAPTFAELKARRAQPRGPISEQETRRRNGQPYTGRPPLTPASIRPRPTHRPTPRQESAA